jgi:hypothetical protein
MNIKDMLRVFPWDKLSHYQWASWFATLGAVITIATMVVQFRIGLPMAALGGAVVAIAVAAIAGFAGERLDQQANDAAAAGGQAPPHEVSTGDIVASALGALPVAAPLLLLWLLSRYL